MMKFIFATLLSITLMGPLARAQGLCGELFGRDIFESHHLREAGLRTNLLSWDVILLERKTFQKKQFLRKARLETYEWSDFKINPDKPGDIRWGVQFLPESLRTLMGLEFLNQQGQKISLHDGDIHYVQVPTPATIRKVMELLSKKFKERNAEYDLMNFYETSNAVLSGKSYLEGIAKNGEMPLAGQGHLFEHDLNYHVYSGLVLPPYVLKAIRDRAELLLGFIKFVEKHPAAQTGSFKQHVNEAVVHNMVESIDIATGNLFKVTIRSDNEKIGDVMHEVQESIDFLFHRQKSPYDFFVKFMMAHPLKPESRALVKEYADSVAAQYRKEDLDGKFLENPTELYNDARAQLRYLDALAKEIINERTR
ncbi:hypothetical protein [Bdellovibrio sp. HCB2-146]|uniref:hypothetical protein n=1 Tax=Bdellovibrio sp. HCB2-146 TaxID=3394362 RepID=UPI0039BD835E